MRPTRRNAQQDNANKTTGMDPFGTVLKESMKSNAHSNDNNINKPSSEAVAVDKTTMTASTTLSSTRDHLPLKTRTLLESMEKELEQRMMPIRRAAEKTQEQLASAHVAGLCRLPRAVKQMTVEEFNRQHGCDLVAILTTNNNNNGSGIGLAKGTALSRDLQTPAVKRPRNPRVPQTGSRTVRRGEVLYSKNGSPVDPVEAGSLVATVAKKRRADGIGVTTGAQFDINVGDGKYINLTDPTSAEDLNEDMKTTALSQLKVLQDQMTSLMAHLET